MSATDEALARALVPLVKALAKILAPLVVAEVRAAADPANVYTSRGPAPPGRSLRWLRDHIPQMPGAVREGGLRGRGVIWSITRVDYEKWRAAKTKTAAAEPEPLAVDDWIRATGYRPTTKKR